MKSDDDDDDTVCIGCLPATAAAAVAIDAEWNRTQLRLAVTDLSTDRTDAANVRNELCVSSNRLDLNSPSALGYCGYE